MWDLLALHRFNITLRALTSSPARILKVHSSTQQWSLLKIAVLQSNLSLISHTILFNLFNSTSHILPPTPHPQREQPPLHCCSLCSLFSWWIDKHMWSIHICIMHVMSHLLLRMSVTSGPRRVTLELWLYLNRYCMWTNHTKNLRSQQKIGIEH